MGIKGLSFGVLTFFSHQANCASSPFLQVYSQLQELKQRDPAKLSTTLTEIADTLRAAATQSYGAQVQKLKDLGKKYDQAAKTGDISQLKQRSGEGQNRYGRVVESSTSFGSFITKSPAVKSEFQETNSAVLLN